MTYSDTSRWVGQPESKTLEFKSSVEPHAIAETVCAMLNSEGGAIVVGVAGDGAIIGVENADERIESLEASIRHRISPPSAWALLTSDVGGKSVIVVDVPNGARKPYVIGGKVYVRSGQATRPAMPDDINNLIQDRIRSEEHWEQQPAVGLTTQDLDQAEIERTIQQSVKAGRFESTVTHPEEALRRLNLVVDDRLLQAAVVAFGSKVLPWYPQCTLRIAKFRGATKDTFDDQQKISGHAFKLLDDANAFLGRYLPISGTFDKGQMVRDDRPLYPILALREALVNAICHRDYSIAGGAVSVAMFDDRLEIASTGTLPKGISIQDLKHEHFSQPRNPLIADLFYRRGLIELWGRGTQAMVRLCDQAGCPEPLFAERAGEFVVTFRAPTSERALTNEHQLTPRQAAVMSALRAATLLGLREIKERVDPSLSDSTIRNDLNRLRELGLIQSEGFGRGAFWRIVRW